MKRLRARGCLFLLGLSLLHMHVPAAAQTGEEVLKGKLVSAGSDTLGSLSSLWAERLRARYPQVLVQVRAIGSGAAPTALIQGTADLGPMSRPMSTSEHQRFFQRYGYAPTAVPVAVDEIVVFVHPDNPLAQIRLPELDALFSATRRCGSPRLLRDWRDLGTSEGEVPRRISLYGRSATSGTYSVFRQEALCGGDFAAYVNRLVGSSAVVRAVASDRGGIGYASAGYLDPTVKALRVVDGSDGRTLRLSRNLFVYINRPPDTTLQPLLAAYLALVLSPEGQDEVARAGYQPLSVRQLRQLRRELGIDHG